MKKRILISTGGSGGHVVPALTLFEHFKNHFDVLISSDKRGSKYIDTANYKFKIINVSPLTKNIFFMPMNIFIFLIAIIKSFLFIKKKKIGTILSTGGYMSLPICISAKILNCRIVLFEPNMVIGRSNLFLLNSCSDILCYSKEIKNFPEKFKHKIRLIPPILRKPIYSQNQKIRKKFSNKIKILIIGGSQGAAFFQKGLMGAISNLSKKFNLYIMHQTNDKNKYQLENFYKDTKIKYNIFNFKEDLYRSVSDVDFCITRAGASSLAELVHLNLPFLTIPFPYAKDNHQYYNALYYKNLNCCWMLDQNNNIQNELTHLFLDISNNQTSIDGKINSMKKISYENSWNNINQKLISILNEN